MLYLFNNHKLNHKMKKHLLTSIFSLFLVFLTFAQNKSHWAEVKDNNFPLSKNSQRESFPKEFKVMQLDLNLLKQSLSVVPNRLKSKTSNVIISIPNTDGVLERFQIFEASNFEPELQAQFPEIRSYVGVGIDDKLAILRMSLDPNGIQAMIFRTDKRNEFIEPYSADGRIYAIFTSSRIKGKLPFTCSTQDQSLANRLSEKAGKQSETLRSSSSELLTFRLALSCVAEYSNYFGATNSSQVGLVLAAFNATMTRVNGVFEKDFTIHMNIIANTTNVIYYAAASDPYSPGATGAGGAWNAELQSTLTSVIGEANYDIGHLFGASGGGGNAGCIGCVCDSGKGSGFTSPANGIPSGDTFDIDYVAHEMGHQFGANHTFSHSNEGSGVNMEPGSGSTIMGYAGITSRDVQSNSDDYFHYASIFQVETNMESKTCPTRTSIANTDAPTVNAGLNYTIPKSTPFILTGTASDPNGVLTYCWEQIDNAGATQINANSAANVTKASGPNWRSYDPVSVPSRYFPRIQSIIANSATTAGLEINVEALSSVARTLNFALTVRDNVAGFGLTNTDAVTINVNGTAGPFAITVPSNTGLSYAVGSNQTVTWNVSGTTANNVNASHVDIFMSTDGGFTYPILLASNVPNDGSEVITIPNNVGTTNRIMVKGHNHIFFDISNNNFAITAPASTFSLAYGGAIGQQNMTICQGNSTSYTLNYAALAGFTGTTNFTATGNPANTTVTFSPSSTNVNGTITVNVTSTAAVALGNYTIVVTGTSGAITKTVNLYLTTVSGNFGTQTLSLPVNLATGIATTTSVSWPSNAAATSYVVEVATDVAFTNIIASGVVTGTTTTVTGLAEITDYYWRVKPFNLGCEGTFSTANKFTTGQSNCTFNYTNNTTLAISDGAGANTAGPTTTKTITVPGTVSGNINAVEVGVTMTHSYVQDLIIELVHPDGTTIKLMNRNCDEGATVNGATYVFNFTNSGTIQLPNGSCLTPSPITGNVKPSDPITIFNGKTAPGVWTLRATDWYNGDTGSIGNWNVKLCMAETPLSNESFGIDNFVLYPNPNNGNFNIQFTSNSGNKIKVNVHDIRGREIFTHNYNNSGLFNESIQLNNVQSGIYLVTVQDGARKEVKKIVVE